MSAKDLRELQHLNAVIRSIDRIIDFGLQRIQQATTDDLKELREYVRRKARELIEKK